MGSHRNVRRPGLRAYAVFCLLGFGCAGSGTQTVRPAGAASRQQQPAMRFASPFAYEAFTRAELARAHGRLAEAVEAYRSALTSDGDDAYLMARLATALDELGQTHAAAEVLTEALELDPRSEDVWLARGSIAEQRGEPAEAYESYEHAESAAPESERAPLALSRLLRAQGHAERAIAVLARFQARTLPGHGAAARAALELALSRRDAAGAYDAASEWLRSHAGAREALLRTARELHESGESLLAERILRAVPATDDDAMLRTNVNLACGRFSDAEAVLAMLAPAAVGGNAALAQLYLTARRPDEALAIATAALVTDPDDARALRVRAAAEAQLGRYIEAAEHAAEVLAGEPNAPLARETLTIALRSQALAEFATEVAKASVSSATRGSGAAQ